MPAHGLSRFQGTKQEKRLSARGQGVHTPIFVLLSLLKALEIRKRNGEHELLLETSFE